MYIIFKIIESIKLLAVGDGLFSNKPTFETLSRQFMCGYVYMRHTEFTWTREFP